MRFLTHNSFILQRNRFSSVVVVGVFHSCGCQVGSDVSYFVFFPFIVMAAGVCVYVHASVCASPLIHDGFNATEPLCTFGNKENNSLAQRVLVALLRCSLIRPAQSGLTASLMLSPVSKLTIVVD